MKAAKLLIILSFLFTPGLAMSEVPSDLGDSFIELEARNHALATNMVAQGHCADTTVDGHIVPCEKACSIMNEVQAGTALGKEGFYFHNIPSTTDIFYVLEVRDAFSDVFVDVLGDEMTFVLSETGGFLLQFQHYKAYQTARSGNGPVDLSDGRNDLGLDVNDFPRVKDYCFGSGETVEITSPGDEIAPDEDEGAYAYIDETTVEPENDFGTAEINEETEDGSDLPADTNDTTTGPSASALDFFVQGGCSLNAKASKAPLASSIILLLGVLALGLRRRRNFS